MSKVTVNMAKLLAVARGRKVPGITYAYKDKEESLIIGTVIYFGIDGDNTRYRYIGAHGGRVEKAVIDEATKWVDVRIAKCETA